MLKNSTSDFKMSPEEEAEFQNMTNLEREKFIARKVEEEKTQRDAEQIKRLNELNRIQTHDIPERTEVASTSKISKCTFALSRDLLIRGIFRSNFNLIRGCFVRVRVNNVYRACKIIGIQESEPYKLPRSRDQKDVYCNIGINLEAGRRRDIMGWPVTNVSNAPILEEEFIDFLREYKMKETTFANTVAKYKTVKDEFTRNLTDTEITETLQRRLRANPRKESNTLVKMRIIKKRDTCIQKKDKEGAEEAQRELEAIEDAEYVSRMKDVHGKEEMEKWIARRKEASINKKK